MPYLRILPVVLLLASLISVAYVTLRRNGGPPSVEEKAQAYSYRGHDFPKTLPLPVHDLPLVALTVEESVHYPILGVESDAEWFGLTSVGYGYVRLGPEDRMFVVTMFHELHCLRLLNLAFSKESFATPEHIQHCLGYIRQGILCAPDLTLEPGNFEDREWDIDRTGATHTCRDWSIVYTIMDDNYYSWINRTHGRRT